MREQVRLLYDERAREIVRQTYIFIAIFGLLSEALELCLLLIVILRSETVVLCPVVSATVV